MPKQQRTLRERIDHHKSDTERRYFALSLRDDLANLLGKGLHHTGMTQRELAKIAGYRSESYISRLMHAETNFKIGVVARVLLPLGIEPVLVDKAEIDRLREVTQRNTESQSKLASTRSAEDEVTITTTRIIHSGSDQPGRITGRWNATPARFANNLGRSGEILDSRKQVEP